jgi:fructose-bisphosphate aldolase class II
MLSLHKNIVPVSEVLSIAARRGYAVGAFNITSFEILKGIVQAMRVVNYPIILQITRSSLDYFGIDRLIGLVLGFAADSSVPFSLHLDHGESIDICRKCINAGFSSVMIDKSDLQFEENIEYTRKVVEIAKSSHVSVEAELGCLDGTEDSAASGDSTFTNPEAALAFVEATKVCCLGVSVGTRHGLHKSADGVAPKLDINRLSEINKALGHEFPLVLHGASSVPERLVRKCNDFGAQITTLSGGISDDDIVLAIKNGVRKINVDTDLRLAFLAGLRESLVVNNHCIDTRTHFASGIKQVEEIVIEKMRLFALLPLQENSLCRDANEYINRPIQY